METIYKKLDKIKLISFQVVDKDINKLLSKIINEIGEKSADNVIKKLDKLENIFSEEEFSMLVLICTARCMYNVIESTKSVDVKNCIESIH